MLEQEKRIFKQEKRIFKQEKRIFKQKKTNDRAADCSCSSLFLAH